MGTSCPTGKQLLALSREDCHNDLGPPSPCRVLQQGVGTVSEDLDPLVEAVAVGRDAVEISRISWQEIF